MSKHDVTQSSNPDVQALLVVISGLARRLDALTNLVSALQSEIDALPEQFVVPGPNGELPQVVDRRPTQDRRPDDADPITGRATAAKDIAVGGDGDVYGVGRSGKVVPASEVDVREANEELLSGPDERSDDDDPS